MKAAPAEHCSDDESRSIAAVVAEEMARRRWSRQRLADEAKISISTLEKALAGRRPFTLTTIVRVGDALGIDLRRPKPGPDGGSRNQPALTAPDELGNYSRASVAWLEGAYLTVIPSFGERSALYAYRTDIHWDEGRTSLCFAEKERVDKAFSHKGSVSVPNQTGHIYLVTNRHGQHRLAILARPASNGDMHGVLSTLQSGRGSHLMPVAAPIVLSPLASHPGAAFGRIAAGHGLYATYRALLKRTLDESFAQMLIV